MSSTLAPPPHANAEAHTKIMTRLRSMTPRQILRTSIDSGIHTPDGKLTSRYQVMHGFRLEEGDHFFLVLLRNAADLDEARKRAQQVTGVKNLNGSVPLFGTELRIEDSSGPVTHSKGVDWVREPKRSPARIVISKD
jgi:hypothetical protein